jgi:hypothetical protein
MNITIEEEFRKLQCSECAVTYYFPEKWCTNAANKHKAWQCPNGHGQAFRDSELDRTRRERDLLKQDAARLEDEKRQAWATATALRERADKAERATKRLRKRTSAGTCPCCNRTFGNMAEHMKHQHPEFVADGGAKVVPIKRKTA